MGQYYYPIILTEKGGRIVGSFYSHEYDNGLKLMEHSYLGNEFVQSVVSRMMTECLETEKPVTLVWLGDYADLIEDVRYYIGQGRNYERIFLRAQRAEEHNLYRLHPDDEKIRRNYGRAANAVFYDVIHKEKISLPKYKAAQIANRVKEGISVDEYGPEAFIAHPIPLLTALGNGKGGGDYHGRCMEWVGKWALHPIIALPDGLPDPQGEWTDISDSVLFEESYNLPKN